MKNIFLLNPRFTLTQLVRFAAKHECTAEEWSERLDLWHLALREERIQESMRRMIADAFSGPNPFNPDSYHP